MTIYSIKESSDKSRKVKIEDNGFGLELRIVKWATQHTFYDVDDGLLSMIRSAIDEYFKNVDQEE